MRLLAGLLAFFALALSAAAASPIPRFDDPRALLEAVYDGFLAMEDWDSYDPDAHFNEDEAFSTRLAELHRQADAIVMADGSEMGALDFSPFIYGQDSGGLTYEIGTPKIKGSRATARPSPPKWTRSPSRVKRRSRSRAGPADRPSRIRRVRRPGN